MARSTIPCLAGGAGPERSATPFARGSRGDTASLSADGAQALTVLRDAFGPQIRRRQLIGDGIGLDAAGGAFVSRQAPSLQLRRRK